MKRVLIAKEWAGMRPFAWLLVILFLLDLLELGVGDLQTWHRSFTLFSGTRWIESTVLSLLLSFAMGSGLLRAKSRMARWPFSTACRCGAARSSCPS